MQLQSTATVADESTPPSASDAFQQSDRAVDHALNGMRDRLNQVLIGKRDKVEMVLACLLAQGHLLLDDLPGTGKTTLAKAIAELFGARFARVQCTPDLLPTDITGFNLFNQKTREFEFRAGPVFSDILLVDELNRTTPRTQSALFEAMAERQVTIDGQTHPLPTGFFVIATQNPFDSHGAFPLPEAQLDRFAMRLEIGYPDVDAQLAILNQQQSVEGREAGSRPSWTLGQLQSLQRRAQSITVHSSMQRYLVALCEESRHNASIQLGVSPRGMIIWQRVAQSWAMLQNRDYVTADDIQSVAEAVVGVRLVVRSGTVQSAIENMIRAVDVPVYR